MTLEGEQLPGGETNPDGGANGQPPKDVDYATYKRTVDAEKKLKLQNKELSDQLAAINAEKAKAQELELLKTNQHETVIENQRKEIAALAEKANTLAEEQASARKLNAAMGLLAQKGLALDPQYMGLIPLNNITVDADGRPDPTSVTAVINDFAKAHPKLVAPAKPDLPGTSPGGSGKKLSLDEWKKLSPAERLVRHQDVKL